LTKNQGEFGLVTIGLKAFCFPCDTGTIPKRMAEIIARSSRGRKDKLLSDLLYKSSFRKEKNIACNAKNTFFIEL